MRGMSDKPSPDAGLFRHARRLQWACGLCFALLFLMGLTGLASITLLHDNPTFTSGLTGIEGATFKVVKALRGFIEHAHEWGGYLSILLAGWAGLEVLTFALRLRRLKDSGRRSTARWLGPAGVLGAVVIVGALLLLLASGVAARNYVKHVSQMHGDELGAIDRGGALTNRDAATADFPKYELAEYHVREFNYLLAAGALLLVIAANRVRGLSTELKKKQDAGD
jgi:hypothetical protein